MKMRFYRCTYCGLILSEKMLMQIAEKDGYEHCPQCNNLKFENVEIPLLKG